MALDETLYDVRMEPAQRGRNAWNRDYVPQKFALGKRTRQEDLAGEQPGRRKLRRTISTKLGNAHDAIWADIKSRPIENPSPSEWQDKNGHFSEDEPTKTRDIDLNIKRASKEQRIPQNDPINHAPAIHSMAPKGLFSRKVVFIHGFSDSKVRSDDFSGSDISSNMQ